MTNEEAKAFLDNLKICIDEHPVVADWLVEIADRKTENSSEKPNNSTKATISKMEQVDEPTGYNLSPVETEPQTSCKTCRYGEVDEGYVRCAYYSKATEQDEPQTEEDYPKNCPYNCNWDE